MGGTKKVKCPICEEKFDLDPDLGIGDTMSCPGCYIDLKIISLTPLKVEEVKDFSEELENEKEYDDEDIEEFDEDYDEDYDDFNTENSN